MPKTWFDFTSSIRPDMAMEQVGKRVVGMRIDVFRSDVLRSLGYAAGIPVSRWPWSKRWTRARYMVRRVHDHRLGAVRRWALPEGCKTLSPPSTSVFRLKPRQADRAILANRSVHCRL